MINSQIRIPTLLGLGVILTGLIIGGFLVNFKQNLLFQTKASTSATPKNITVANISGTSASIYWQTEESASGFIQAGEDTTKQDLIFNDIRDLLSPQDHNLHFVNLTNLKPDSIYYYKVISSGMTYPAKEALSFKTAAENDPSDYQPIIGTIMDQNFQPSIEALITLDIPGAQKLSAITKVAGNFILPLSQIRTSDLADRFDIIESSPSATLYITDSTSNSSKVSLLLPLTNSVIPLITLGKDLDLTIKNASLSAVPVKYDLNDDGVINSLDLSIILQNFGKKNFGRRTDLNGDGVVDQKDVIIISKFIPHTSPK